MNGCFAISTAGASVLLLIVLQAKTSVGFLPTTCPSHLDASTWLLARADPKRCSSSSSSKLQLGIEPFLPDIAIATVSAAAGAATQIPRIRGLERDLKTAKEALSESELEMVAKIHTLEDKLHQMDDEFEHQTAKIKKNFDHTLRDEVARVAAKAKEDYEFKLNIEMKEERLKILTETASRFNFGAKRQAELDKLRKEQEEIAKANKELEDALFKSEQELAKISELSSKKKGGGPGWWPFA